jgi:hypothetical protein
VKPVWQVDVHAVELQTIREFFGVGGFSTQGLLFVNWHCGPSKISGQIQTFGALQKPKFWQGGVQIAVEWEKKINQSISENIYERKLLFPPLRGTDLIGTGLIGAFSNAAELDNVGGRTGTWVVTFDNPHSGRIRITDWGQSQIIVFGLNIVGGLQVFSTCWTPLGRLMQW